MLLGHAIKTLNTLRFPSKCLTQSAVQVLTFPIGDSEEIGARLNNVHPLLGRLTVSCEGAEHQSREQEKKLPQM